MSTPSITGTYIDLLEIDTFRVIKDVNFPDAVGKRNNNISEHWIAHMCTAYKRDPDHDEDNAAFDSDEIREGKCYYCKRKIPEAILALWSMLEWDTAGDILHTDKRAIPVKS